MERSTPVRTPHTSTADLLTWTESPFPTTTTSNHRSSHHPSDKMSKVLHGVQLTDEEASSLNNTKQCSGYKLKEMSGSGIFASNGDDEISGSVTTNSHNKTSVRICQQPMNGISQISFGHDEKVSPKKPVSIPEVAKQRELSGTLQSDANIKSKKQISDAKFKEISGHDIFAPTPAAVPPRSHSFEPKESQEAERPAPRNIRTSVKVSNPAGGQSNIIFGEEPVVKTARKIHDQKFHELIGNNIFQGDTHHGSVEKPLSNAKLREMNGSDIFADGKVQARDYFGGVRKPPGGESSISLE